MFYFKKYFICLIFLSIGFSGFTLEAMFSRLAYRVGMPALATAAVGVWPNMHKNNTVLHNQGQEKADTEKFKEKITLLDDLLKRIPPEKFLDAIVEDKKIALIRMIYDAKSSRNGTEKNREKALFETKVYQTVIDEKYTDKKLNETVFDRIGDKFIGTIPEQIKDMVIYFSNYNYHVKNKTSIYNRVLLYGKPGTGKSFLAKIVAQELQLPIISVSASVFADKYIGESSRKIRSLFEMAKKIDGPVIIFIDEIDAIATKRTGTMHEEHRGTLITLLTELQEIQTCNNIYVIAATNVDPFEKEDREKPHKTFLDPAVKDRFSGSVCEIKPLDKNDRVKLLLKLFKDYNVNVHHDMISNEISDDMNKGVATRLAEVFTSEFSNRDIECIVISAQLKRRNAYLTDSKNIKHFCYYVKQAIDSSGKRGSYAWISSTYCDGI